MTEREKVQKAMADGHVSVVEIGKILNMDPERVKVIIGDICHEQYLEAKKRFDDDQRKYRPYTDEEIDQIIRMVRDECAYQEIADELDRDKGSICLKIKGLRKEGRL